MQFECANFVIINIQQSSFFFNFGGKNLAVNTTAAGINTTVSAVSTTEVP